MLTSSIERRASCSRSNGASATSSSPAARSSSSSARSVTLSRAASCSRSASENAETGSARRRRPRPRATRSTAAARLAGDADDPQLRPPPADARPGAPASAGTSATRTNVVRVPCRRRRTSSASMPRLMMSWVAARVDSSASVTNGARSACRSPVRGCCSSRTPDAEIARRGDGPDQLRVGAARVRASVAAAPCNRPGSAAPRAKVSVASGG